VQKLYLTWYLYPEFLYANYEEFLMCRKNKQNMFVLFYVS